MATRARRHATGARALRHRVEVRRRERRGLRGRATTYITLSDGSGPSGPGLAYAHLAAADAFEAIERDAAVPAGCAAAATGLCASGANRARAADPSRECRPGIASSRRPTRRWVARSRLSSGVATAPWWPRWCVARRDARPIARAVIVRRRAERADDVRQVGDETEQHALESAARRLRVTANEQGRSLESASVMRQLGVPREELHASSAARMRAAGG